MNAIDNLFDVVYPQVSIKNSQIFQKISGTKKYILMPLKYKKEIVGGIFISSKQRKVSEDEKKFIKTLGQTAVTAIRNAKFYKQAIQQNKQ